MGSQSKKRKTSTDPRIIIEEIKDTQDADVIRMATLPTFETNRIPEIRTSIDYVNVTESIDPSQG
jgi:hypothetical protein